MSFRIIVERRAQKALACITEPHRGRIAEALLGLAHQPRPAGARKLTGRPAWRIRVGDYRVIYEIEDDHLVVLIVDLGHRQGIYRS